MKTKNLLKVTCNAVRQTRVRRFALASVLFHAEKLHIANLGAWIHIEFVAGKEKNEKTYADCAMVKKNTIVIEIDAHLKNDRMLEIIAHEMVHAKQYLKGQLATRGNSLIWKGKKVSSKLAYHETPWEKEAMSKEIIMKHAFSHAAREALE